jgi:hypothetical protein
VLTKIIVIWLMAPYILVCGIIALERLSSSSRFSRMWLECSEDRDSSLLRNVGRLLLKCDGTRAEMRFRFSVKRTRPFKSARASVQSSTGSRGVRISLQGLYCSCKPVLCSHVTLTGYPLHSLVSPSRLLPCVTVCHHITTGLYHHTIVHVTTSLHTVILQLSWTATKVALLSLRVHAM